ncbi:MAG TPA: MopE-related protein [Kofleriaceae bacterium]|nr:MopE-related protein [Kofleriaceae bacterium]
MIRRLLPGAALALALVHAPQAAHAATCTPTGSDLVVDGITCQLSGVHTFQNVRVINGGIIEVNAYDGLGNKVTSGNLELRARTILIGANSRITARGRGYQTRICGDGTGPTVAAAGKGGCSLRDSGGGGAHFGGGGRGTKDNPTTFPAGYEESCGNSVTYNGSGVPSCSDVSDCRNNDGLPTIAGAAFFHSIYQPEFGASGGDKGCRDGDGTTVNVSGGGGGRIVLAGLNGGAGTVTIDGTLDANGRRGCGNGNDSAGGGAGGTIFVVGESVTIGAAAVITAAGGLGGDTQGLATDPTGECVAPAQQGTQADDCGGGGGGGIVSVLSVTSSIHDRATFSVAGAAGGVSNICRGEAGGGVGELQISGGYVGEFCDGFDNDFDDLVDENMPVLSCGSSSMPSCMGGVPQTCPGDVPACQGAVTDSRARFTIIVDTSGSMLGTLGGVPTFGDGSLAHPGLDHNANGMADDSRLFQAKNALNTVIAAYPQIDFSLARYHQDQSVDRSCQMAHNFECASICCSYDNPVGNTGPAPTPACNVNGGTAGTLAVLKDSGGDECINYAGNCGPPRRGADILVGFGADINQHLRWLDGAETNFINSEAQGNYCDFAAGGDCELRGTGPTPLANSLAAVEDYLTPIKACDLASTGGCRRYGVILVTDGAESCQGNPVTAATALRMKGIDTYVVGFSVLASEQAQLNAIAAAGNTGTAFLVGNENQLANALATIVSGSIVFETCNNLDDDCDTRVDEDFPEKGNACDDGRLGACRGTGTLVCNGTGSGLQCNITNPGATPVNEVCNGLDDNCNGAIDEGINCTPGCVPTDPVDECNGIDDDCDGAFEEDDPQVGLPCGTNDMSPCMFGTNVCVGGSIVCVGAVDPQTEQCNGVDDNCDGIPDDNAQCPVTTSCIEGGCRLPCGTGEFPCPAGFRCDTTSDGRFCVPSACASCTPNEICQNDMCVDPCMGVTCDPMETCRFGACVDCDVLGCPSGEVCIESACVADPCAGVDCASGCTEPLGCSCNDGACVPNCDDTLCPGGQRCNAEGACVPDSCADRECPGTDVCVDGVCTDDPCAAISCDAGEVCSGGVCVEDPCKLVECSEDFVCVVRDGDAQCTPEHPAGRPDRVQPAGGGGCSAGGGGGGGATLVVIVLAFVALRARSRHRRRTLAVVIVASLAAGAGCGLNPFDLNNGATGDDGDSGNGDGDGGGGDGDGGIDTPSCTPIGVDDQCNELDDDCDGIVDNNFNKQIDSNNCGTCNHRCIGAGAVQSCAAGQCEFLMCQPGFADLDSDPLTCEYMCPLFPGRAEDCNGFDDDCDGVVDEDLPAPPSGQCRVTANTPCAGTTMTCATRGGQTRWFCDYDADVEFDPSVPNGIVLAEQKCDGLDGDCDGIADDTFTDLGQECDNGGLGVCRDVGERVCDPADSSQTRCDLTVLPNAQTPVAERCDGLDNNCDGTVDNASGVDRVVDAMTHVQVGVLDFYMDTYEASHPDATALVTGVSTARACSNASVLPWRNVSWNAAQAACQAAGKQLCSALQWQSACEGTANTTFPYGNSFSAAACNTEPHDGISGGNDDDVLLATGALGTCVASTGVLDLSGNLKEWTNDITGQTAGGTSIAVLRGGAYDTPAVGATCDFRTSRAAVNVLEPEYGFRCCRLTAP